MPVPDLTYGCPGCAFSFRALDVFIHTAVDAEVAAGADPRTAMLHVSAAVASWWMDRSMKMFKDRVRGEQAIRACLTNVFREQDMTDVTLDALVAEVDRLKAGRFTAEEIHAFCHTLPATVTAREFADGCAAEQRRLYGCAPDADIADIAHRHTLQVRPYEEPALSVECGAHPYTPDASGVCTGCGGPGVESHWGHRT